MADSFPHLPAGHEPGVQSLRNRAERTFWAPFVTVVGVCMFMAGVWVAAGGRGDAFDRQEELFGGIIFALGGLLCVYGGGAIQAKGRPERHPSLRGATLQVDAGDARRGRELSVAFAGERTDGDRLEVGLVCVERYDIQVNAYVRGARVARRETVEGRAHEQWQAVPEGVRELDFGFVVPREAPYSYEGECVSFAWFATARAVRRRRKDARLEVPVWVRP